jgi:uncharacterized protein YbaR (Trm112 family)
MLNGARRYGSMGTDLVREVGALVRERRHHRPAPPATGLVLDVGAGDAPFPRSDVVVDKYVVDDFERGGDLAFGKPVIVADAEALPFADGAFAYVIAAHVLEHAIDPVRMAAEFSRVGAAGFVQLPTASAELVYGWPFHPWLVERRGDTLVFRPKEHEAPTAGRTMHDAYAESLLLRVGWAAHRSRWHHSVHWTGRLEVEVAGERRHHDQADLDLERTLDALGLLARDGKVTPMGADLRAILRCPEADCRSPLTWEADSVRCTGCDRCYPAPGGVPVLLAEAAVSAPVA